MFRVLCLPLSTIDNGSVNYTTPLTQEWYSFDILAELYCDQGYKPSTSSQERCPKMSAIRRMEKIYTDIQCHL